jgi:hypothetical protein
MYGSTWNVCLHCAESAQNRQKYATCLKWLLCLSQDCRPVQADTAKVYHYHLQHCQSYWFSSTREWQVVRAAQQGCSARFSVFRSWLWHGFVTTDWSPSFGDLGLFWTLSLCRWTRVHYERETSHADCSMLPSRVKLDTGADSVVSKTSRLCSKGITGMAMGVRAGSPSSSSSERGRDHFGSCLRVGSGTKELSCLY